MRPKSLMAGSPAQIAASLLALLPAPASAREDYYQDATRRAIAVVLTALRASGKHAVTSFDPVAELLLSGDALVALEQELPAGGARSALVLFLDEYRTRMANGEVRLRQDLLEHSFGAVLGQLRTRLSEGSADRAVNGAAHA